MAQWFFGRLLTIMASIPLITRLNGRIPMSDILLVMTTLPDQTAAEQLAGQLLSKKLAACINILPSMSSLYMWKGELEHGREHLLLIKTQRDRYEALEAEIHNRHPYELPEIIGVPVVAGLAGYLDWIEESTASPDISNTRTRV